MLPPDGQVGPGHARVGRQDEDDGMRLRNQADRQFGLRADGVEPRRVKNHQPLPEQRMGNIDQRMAPFRHLDPAIGRHRRIVIKTAVIPEA